jgi:integrase
VTEGTGTLAADRREGERANERKEISRMARRRYQTGCLYTRGKRCKVWVARWREDVILPDNTVDRVHRSEVLGLVSDIPTRREAQKLLQTRLRDINDGRQRPKAMVTLQQFVEQQWKLSVLPTIKVSSAKHYEFDLDHYILPALGSKPLCDLTREKVQTFIAGKRREGYAGATVHSMRTTLSKVLQSAVDWNYLEENPAHGIRIGDRAPVRERKFLGPDQIRQVLEALPEPCRTLVLLAVASGMRIGELLALRWKHIDFLRGVISIRESFYRGRFDTPKTRCSRRDIPMSEAIQQALLAHRGHSRNTEPEALVFVSRTQTPVNPKNMLRRVLQPTCKKLGLPLVSWHSFRHSHATLLSEAGESLKTAQAILGHSDLKTTLNIYTHAIPESERRAVERVAGILFPNVPKSSGSTENGKAN